MQSSKTAKALTFAAIFTLALIAGPPAKAANRCSNATLSGSYSDQDTGYIIGVGPFAGVNVDTFDGKGHISISGMSSLNGSVFPGAESGAYTVSSDCTGTYSVKDSENNVYNAYFVIDQSGNELQILITNPGTVIHCLARKQFPDDED